LDKTTKAPRAWHASRFLAAFIAGPGGEIGGRKELKIPGLSLTRKDLRAVFVTTL
jgi:hypothetical protein